MEETDASNKKTNDEAIAIATLVGRHEKGQQLLLKTV